MATAVVNRDDVDIPELLPYQRAWIQDESAVKVYEKSRGVGITWAEALDAVLDASNPDGQDWYYLGYEKEMTAGFIKAAQGWIEKFKKITPAVKPVDDVFPKETDVNVFHVRFPSGHSISTLTSEPRNLRSRHRCVAVIDEAAFHDDLQALLDAAYAITTWHGRIHIISTHNGVDNPFNSLVNDIRAGRSNFKLYRTTIDDALGAGLFKAICKDSKKEWSYPAEMAWRAEQFARYSFEESAEQELLCVPAKGGGVFLPTELIEARMKEGIPVIRGRDQTAFDNVQADLEMALRIQLNPQLQSCFGVDFGRSGDITVIWPLQIAPDMKRITPFIVELRNVEYEVQKRILFSIVDRLPRFFSGALDATGNGGYLAEAAGLRYGANTLKSSDPKVLKHGGRIEGVMLNVEWYRENMPRYKAGFEDAKLEIPCHADILADHKLIRMERGIARVPETRTRGSDTGQRHGDSAIAGALAYYASFQGGTEYAYQPVATAPSIRDLGRRAPDDDDYPRSPRGWGTSRARWPKGSW